MKKVLVKIILLFMSLLLGLYSCNNKYFMVGDNGIIENGTPESEGIPDNIVAGGTNQGVGGSLGNNEGGSQNNGNPSQNNGEPSQNNGEPSQNNGEPIQNNGEPSQNNGEPIQNNVEPPQNNEEPPEEEVYEIQLSKDLNIVNVGDTVTFTATLGENDITESAEWISADESIAIGNGNGSFTALDAGMVQITASYEDKLTTMNLQVQFPGTEVLTPKARYSRLVWGVENCIGGADPSYKYYTISGSPLTLYCGPHGDCDDTGLVITGDSLDLTLGIYADRMYLIANKNQIVTIKTFSTGSWGNTENINNNSRINVDIKNKYNEIVSDSKSLYMLDVNPNHQGEGLDDGSVYVRSGEYIDIRANYVGVVVAAGQCPAVSKLSSIKTNLSDLTRSKGGFWLVTTTFAGYITSVIEE